MKEPSLKKKNTLIIFPTFFAIFFVILLITIGIRIFKYYSDNKKTDDVISNINDLVNLQEEKEIEKSDNENNETENIDVDNKKIESSDYIIDYQNLKNVNNDFVGYIIVPGTNISQTVVKGSDNDFYLHHNFYKKYDVAGWIFADYANKFDGTDKNIIIYGHNMKTGTMFGSLKNVLTDSWYINRNNRFITFIDENGNQKYEVFSVYIIESEDYYRKVNFLEEEFDLFIKTILKRSIHSFDVEVGENDKILTLSTCHTDNRYRVVVHAKKI